MTNNSSASRAASLERYVSELQHQLADERDRRDKYIKEVVDRSRHQVAELEARINTLTDQFIAIASLKREPMVVACDKPEDAFAAWKNIDHPDTDRMKAIRRICEEWRKDALDDNEAIGMVNEICLGEVSAEASLAIWEEKS